MALGRFVTRTGVLLGGAVWALAAVAPHADAHPLGNFSVNHYLGLTVLTDRIEALAVTDTAEIPTLQEQTLVDRDRDGTVDDGERAAWAAEQCAQTAQRLRVTTGSGGQALTWTVRSETFQYAAGAAGLRTSRLECGMDAPLQLAQHGTVVDVSTGVDPTRVGWNEITARGEGVELSQSDVPQTSASHELRDYPRDLLDNPRGVTHARFTVAPGAALPIAATAGLDPAPGGPSAWMASLNRRLVDLGAGSRLTIPVGLLAVLLAVLLGAGHALLPGHGKTIMAAYLAGRRGSARDALTVGATVTVTHTAGVLVVGLCLTAFSSLAGDVLLGWLGVSSGALVALVGAGLLRDAVRRARSGRGAVEVVGQRRDPARELVPAGMAGAGHHGHDHMDDHDDHDEHDHDHDHDEHDHDHDHEHPHSHGHHHHHHPHEGRRPLGRRGLVGLGIAGVLVPSPSALVVLLGAVALGRTFFGVGLVVAYGLGMAGTLTAVGLLLVRLGDRLAGAADGPLVHRLRRFAPYTALLTALLVVAVGLGLLIRSLPSAL